MVAVVVFVVVVVVVVVAVGSQSTPPQSGARAPGYVAPECSPAQAYEKTRLGNLGLT